LIMYLLDTNILSELVKKKPNDNLIARLESVPFISLYTASICIMELRYGALRMKNGEDLWAKIQTRIVSKLQIIPFSYKEALKAAEILHELYSVGRPIGIEDIMIASIALSNRLIVISGNIKHFSRVPNLPVENWLW